MSGPARVAGMRELIASAEDLSSDELDALAEAAAGGDLAARDRVIASTIRLAAWKAAEFGRLMTKRRMLVDEDDAYSAAMEGLLKAIQTYDRSKGTFRAWLGIKVFRGELETKLRRPADRRADRETPDFIVIRVKSELYDDTENEIEIERPLGVVRTSIADLEIEDLEMYRMILEQEC